ncbi:MAG: GtrA family protein [Cytophagales bacterium]|nr:GtrA family protein [Rhizobacter sp.]
MAVDTATALGSQFGRYLVAGGIAALANYGSRFIFSRWFSFEVAVTLAFCVGLCTGFCLMRSFAFRASTRPARQQALGYMTVNLFALLQTYIVSSLLRALLLPLLDSPGAAEAIAHAMGVAVPVVTSYFGHRLLTFKS